MGNLNPQAKIPPVKPDEKRPDFARRLARGFKACPGTVDFRSARYHSDWLAMPT